ncbi:Ankyrin repeat and EF-hand domain-containing protein 1 [Phytophthora boehmeriae]|uniref:Ankyrin repeat and EF-hand domain-containing protein 1 n=1 Tax=Phytophthora boehmeriae TaxID=109152 RepID=A0A8T1VZW3_9STRA|nr:Ankyrin repeat and EF-hand domain-containing protein 1 [Phytophthora boehmeriae]
MTASSDYHALPDQSAPAPVSSHGGERVSRRSSRRSTNSEKVSRPLIPPDVDSTSAAIMELVDVEEDPEAALPRGSPKPLPKAFLGPGYGRNSYFAWRLRVSSMLVAVISAIGIVAFWASKDIAYGGINVNDIWYALSFGRTKTTECVEDTDYCGDCDTIVVYSMLVFHVSPLVGVVGLPASGLRIFDPFRRRQRGDERQKVRRSVFFQLCELLSVVVLALSMIVILYFLYAISQGTSFYCDETWSVVYVVFAVANFLINFVVLTYFARFREHLMMQLGVFKEADQTGGIRSRLKCRRRYQSERSRVIRDLRKDLFKQTSLGNLSEIEALLAHAKERLGTDFAKEMYSDAKLVFNLFGNSKKNPLHVAAYLGNLEALQLLLDAGFSIDSYDKVARMRFTTGDLFWAFAQVFVNTPTTSEVEMEASIFRTTLVTPLHCAVGTGQITAVEWLIEHGANVNSKSKASYRSDRLTPLFVAENPDIVRLLLEAGANHLEVADPGYMNTLTPLQQAYRIDNFPVAHELEQWGADVALTPLHEAAAKDDLSTVKKLLKYGADPNCVGEYGYSGMHHRTPLHWAAIMGAEGAVKLLLDAGSDPNFQDVFGRSPLHWASCVKKPGAVLLLLDNGGDVNLRDYRDQTPLMCAASSKDVSVDLFESLVQYGADIDDHLPNGDTALHIAMKSEQKGTALALLDAGADVMETNKDGYRPVDCTTSTQLQFEIKQAAGDRDVMISYTHSHKSTPVTDEMQVYIFTRQMVPFESAITAVDNTNKRKITYEYNEERFTSQFRLLLDGVRDEIEKGREPNANAGSQRRLINVASGTGFGENTSEWDPESLDNTEFAFVSHGDHHHSFVTRLHDRLQDNQVRCIVDGKQTYVDMTERIHAAKEAILKCSVFIVVLSRKTVNSELVRDQLAFAEDKGRTILPLMLNDMEVPLDKHYTLSRLELLHFTPELGFHSSYQQLLNRVRSTMTGTRGSLTTPIPATRPTFRAIAQMAIKSLREPHGAVPGNSARGFLRHSLLSETTAATAT